MKPIYRQAVLGPGPAIPMDYRTVPFAVGVMGVPSSNATLTWAVQHTLDDPGPDGAFPVSYSQTTTVITVTDLRQLNGVNGHGLSVGDSVYLAGVPGIPDSTELTVATVTSQSVYTLTAPLSQSAAGNAVAHNFRWDTHVSLTGQTGRNDGNYAFPVRAIRLNITAYTAGYIDLMLLQGWSH
jgi:hypothetical protein